MRTEPGTDLSHPPAPGPTERTGYRPEIDGLRSIAVLLVVAFHADMSLATGGFVGVDVFFVLSGFLITGLLVDEGRQRRIDLAGFYARRSRRLLPAALVVILAICVTWVLTASTLEREGLGGDARAAALYFSNWHFAGQATDYFHQTDSPSPFLHFWSLSAEEQFYLAWPALVAGAVLLARRLRRSVIGVVRVLAAALLAASLASLLLTARHGSEPYAYFATTNRVYQLLAGGLLALHLRSRRTHRVTGAAAPAQLLAIGALLVLASSAFEVSSTVRGVLVVAVTIPLLWALDRSPAAPVGSLLSSRPLVWVGRVSYGVYLWHWPIVLLLKKYWDMKPYEVAIVCTVLSLGIAGTSNRLVEQPVRTAKSLAPRGRVVIVAGLALSALVGVVVAPGVLGIERRPVFSEPLPDGAGQVTLPTAPDGSAVPETTEPVALPSASELGEMLQVGPGAACLPQPLPTCLLHEGHGFTLAVMGDSHSEQFKEVFADIGAKYDITVYMSTYLLCPWLRGVYPSGKHPDCKERKERWYTEALPQMHADAVLTINRAYDDTALPHDLVTEDGSNETAPGPVLSANWERAVDELRLHTQRVVVVQPWPSTPFSQKLCLAAATSVEQCAAIAADLPSDEALHALDAERDDLDVVDLDPQICPRMPICDPITDGVLVRKDKNHLTYRMARLLQPVLEQRLQAIGVLQVAPTAAASGG